MNQSAKTNWKALFALAMGMFIVMLDITLVAIALPAMRADLGVSTTTIEWVVLGYTLPLVALALPIGRFVDQVAARHKLFMWALAGFAASSVAIGLAPSVEVVVVGRIFQGVFAAGMSSVIPIMALSVAVPQQRARAMSVIATTGPTGAVLGPALGGYLLEIASWNWIFFINVPIAAAVVLFARGRFEDVVPNEKTAKDRRWIGEAAILVVATAALLYGLTKVAEEQWWLAALLMAISVASVVLWVRTTRDRRLLEMLRTPSINRGPIGQAMMTTCSGSIGLVMPFILIDQFDTAVRVAGSTLLLSSLGMMLTGPVGGILADRFGPPRVALAGALISIIAALLLLRIDAGWSLVQIGAVLFISGIGLGLFIGPNMALTMSSAPADGGGAVGSMTALARNMGFSLGPALATIVWHLSSITDAFWVAAGAAALAAAATIPLLVRSGRPALASAVAAPDDT